MERPSALADGLSICQGAELLCGDRLDRGETAAVAAVDKLHPTGDLGEEGVFRTDANVRSRLDAGATLTDDDRTAGDEFAGKGLYAQPLCIGVASVCGAASTLLMCHCLIPFSKLVSAAARV